MWNFFSRHFLSCDDPSGQEKGDVSLKTVRLKNIYTKVFRLFVCFCFSGTLAAQPYGNEWINYSQQYFKIKIAGEGIYRISRNTMLSAAMPITSIDPRKLQLFYKGKELNIHVEGEGDGVFDSNDFIEFYGQKNDGLFDTSLYNLSSEQANPAYSLFSDTSCYYLTWNNSLTNKRLTQENDINFSGYTPLNSFICELRENYATEYLNGTPSIAETSPFGYQEGEGWYDNPFYIGGNTSKSLGTTNIYTSGSKATLETVVFGASNDYAVSTGDHHLRIQLGGFLFDTIYEGYGLRRFTFSIPLSFMGGTSTLTYSSINDLGLSADRNAVAYVRLRYPHTFDLESRNIFTLFVPDDATKSSALLSFSNFNTGGVPPLLYDLTNSRRIKVDISAGIKALVPNSGGEKRCLLVAESQVQQITSVTPVNIDPVNPGNYAKFINLNLLAVDSAYVIITHASLMNEAKQYAAYRALTYNVVLMDIEELYDQFAHGIAQHPLAIRNFASYLMGAWPSSPRSFFLIGKSLNPITARQPLYYNQNLVPTYGYPSTDNLLTALIDSNDYFLRIPIGRLAAKTPGDVTLYLNKVKEYESQQPAEWMKQVLHFGGGANVSEQSSFSAYLNAFKDTIADTLFGGFVTSFFKTSTEPIQLNQSDKLKNLIDNGVSLMTFFGHATSNGWDQNTDAPSAYNNKGKYPFIIANSCYSGDIHGTGQSKSEEFMLIADKGAIGFLASVALGYARPLSNYTQELYAEIARRSYGRPVGKCIENAVATLSTKYPSSDMLLQSTAMEMTLHGDPAIIINAQPKVDMQITNPDIFFTPAEVTTELDSFEVNFIATNIGRATSDSFDIRVTRIFPDGITDTTLILRVPYVPYKDTFVVRMPVEPGNGAGLNSFSVTLDANNMLDELSEFNNIASASLLIKSSDVTPVYPVKYAIIPMDSITLKISTNNPFAVPSTYVFEIDTTDQFDSPLKMSGKITQGGGVVGWRVPFLLQDSTVYYWRASTDSTSQKGYSWKESSFIYIKTLTGWSQAHFFQFKNDVYENVDYNRTTRSLDFITNTASIKCTNYLKPVNPGLIGYEINSSWGESNTCYYTPGIYVAVFDSVALTAWGTRYGTSNPNNNFGNLNDNGACRPNVEYYFIFNTTSAQEMDSLTNLINNKIPNGNYVLLYSVYNGNFETWNNNWYQAFENLGADSVRSLKNYQPYIYFVKKGDPSTGVEMVGDSVNALVMTSSMSGKWYSGSVVSEVIGPAANWTSVHWRTNPVEPGGTRDSVYLDLIGITAGGTETTLVTQQPRDSADFFISSIDASLYPYIKLKAYLRDDSLRTPPQFGKWQVYYDRLPEYALNPSKYFSFYKDTLDEGEEVSFATVVENISDIPGDSITVSFWNIDRNRIKNTFPDASKRKLMPGDTAVYTLRFNTQNFNGANKLWIEANPYGSLHKAEEFHFNNIGQIPFYVKKDITNPLLDVTFDGYRILNGDIVSSRPLISIRLNDENKFLALNDTSLFAVYLQTPSRPAERVHFESDPGLSTNRVLLKWSPATSATQNNFRIEFQPELSEDGTYQLIVQAKDVSSNQSGAIDYKINFEVVTQSSITEVMNFPNPFSTQTHFVFTLTGAEIPSYMKIQVMTVAGKIVREITRDELGPLRIGRNMTQYAWDGKDQYGDPLANGVYLYRVITSLNGADMEKRSSGADRFFKKGWGKMYLMR